jgi:hypothetical protein
MVIVGVKCLKVDMDIITGEQNIQTVHVSMPKHNATQHGTSSKQTLKPTKKKKDRIANQKQGSKNPSFIDAPMAFSPSITSSNSF